MAVEDSEEGMADFINEGGFTFPVMLDANPAARDYGVRPIPTLFIIDAEGSCGRSSARCESVGSVDDLTR
jgi:hypothetical protein